MANSRLPMPSEIIEILSAKRRIRYTPNISGNTLQSIDILNETIEPDSVLDLSMLDNVETINSLSDRFKNTDEYYPLEIILPKNLSRIGTNCFDHYYGLESISATNVIEYIDRAAFNNCRKLKDLSFIDPIQTRIGQYAFNGCYSITNIEIHSSLLLHSNEYCFYGCPYLKTITVLPDKTDVPGEYSSYSVPSYAFAAASYYVTPSPDAKIILAEGCGSIYDHAFLDRGSRYSIFLPSSLRYIGESAFWQTVLSPAYHFDIYYEGTEEEWTNISKHSKAFPTNMEQYFTIHYNSKPEDLA